MRLSVVNYPERTHNPMQSTFCYDLQELCPPLSKSFRKISSRKFSFQKQFIDEVTSHFHTQAMFEQFRHELFNLKNLIFLGCVWCTRVMVYRGIGENNHLIWYVTENKLVSGHAKLNFPPVWWVGGCGWGTLFLLRFLRPSQTKKYHIRYQTDSVDLWYSVANMGLWNMRNVP